MAFSIIRRTKSTTNGSFRRRRQQQQHGGPIILSRYRQKHRQHHHYYAHLLFSSLFPSRLSLHKVPLSILANSNNIDSDFEREFQQKQKQLSDEVRGDDDTTSTSSSQSLEEHSKHQAKVFNELATFFDSEEAIPQEVVPILQDMANSMIAQMIHQRSRGEETNQKYRPARVTTTATTNDFHVLDVGCGTGALFDFYIKAAEANNVTLHIHGLDLASTMVQRAKSHAKEVLAKLPTSNKEHSITVELGDICCADEGDDETESERQSQYYDLAVANACFGNFWDQKQALTRMANSLRLDGVLCITHPLGSDFVRQLHDDDPKSVPHLLPSNLSEFQQLAQNLPLHVLEVVDRDKGDDDDGDSSTYYKATAAKVVHQGLSQTMRFRGQVDSGYGRGGKQLGFPTANLPSRLFQDALQDVRCGVYFGWAVLEGTTKGRSTPHKAVVNVGYSPTFEGQENPEKIIEAHLMFPPTMEQQQGGDASPPTVLDPPDFYGEVMRLQLVGFIRPEMKFPSFPALIAQITTDVEDAREALDLDCYRDCRKHPFVAEFQDEWIGSGGGDGDASWEFD